ncbi:MAG: hypothetical protein CFE45_28220, partial [Burkholderiales bacterium PBB5]
MPGAQASAGLLPPLRAGDRSFMSPSSFAAVLRHPTGRGLIAAWRALLLVTLAVWSLAVLAWLTLHWGILPRLNDWRPQIEAWASRSIGHPLQIGRIDVRSSGWVPAFTLRDVVLRDARGAEALRLPQVDAALDVPTLLTARLRFAQLLVDGARLAVRRDTEGRWHVAGLDVDSGAAASADAGALADWFFAQHEFVIRGGTVRWTDEQRAAPPLQLDNVTLAVRNRFGRHAFKLQATPVAADGARFTLVAQLRAPLWARAGDWRRWAGTLYADLPDTDLALLRRHVDLPLDLRQGRAALRAWLDIDQAQATALTL